MKSIIEVCEKFETLVTFEKLSGGRFKEYNISEDFIIFPLSKNTQNLLKTERL